MEAKFRRDNPGGDWLKREQARAEEGDVSHHKAVRGSTTGWFTHNLKLPVSALKDLPGTRDEQYHRNDFSSPKHKWLAKDIEDSGGFDSKKYPIMIGVNHKGEAHVMEGNHRLAYAAKNGISHIHTEFKYYNGGEDVNGPFHPSKVAKMHNDSEMNEEAPTNAVGSGNIASVGIGPQGEPPAIPASINNKKKRMKFSEFVRRNVK